MNASGSVRVVLVAHHEIGRFDVPMNESNVVKQFDAIKTLDSYSRPRRYTHSLIRTVQLQLFAIRLLLETLQ